MPINLKELFIDDSNQIRIEKINYNFDQMISVGGQIGPKGTKGDFGPIGPEGDKGQKGEQGPVGVAGSNGADGLNFWEDIAHDSNLGYSSKILKPVDFNGFSGLTAVYLGDPDFDLAADPANLGDQTPRAVLTINKDSIFDNHLKIVGQSSNMVMRSEFFAQSEIYGGDVFSIKKDSNLASNLSKLEVAFDDVNITSTGPSPKGVITLSSNNTVDITAENGLSVLGGTISTFNDVAYFNSNLIVNGTGFTKVSSGSTNQRNEIPANELSGGCIRYNTSTNKLEARFNGTYGGPTWLPLRELRDSDGDTRIDIPVNTDEDAIRLFTDGDLALRIGGTTASLTPFSSPSTNLEVPVVSNYKIFSQRGIHINSYGNGISFKEGDSSNTVAPSYGTPVQRRTLDDYFERHTGFFPVSLNQIPASETGIDPLQAEDQIPGSIEDCIVTNSIFRADPNSGGSNAVGNGKITCTVNTNESQVTYTKIGNVITVSVHLKFTNDPLGYSFSNSDNTMGDASNTGQLLMYLPGILNIYEPENTCRFTVHASGLYINTLIPDEVSSIMGSLEKGTDYIRMWGVRPDASNEAFGNIINIRSGGVSKTEFSFLEFNFTFTYFTNDKAYITPITQIDENIILGAGSSSGEEGGGVIRPD